MTRPKSRRDFLLDSGGVSALIKDKDLLAAYLRVIRTQFDGAILIPTPVLGEIYMGKPQDALVDLLLKKLGGKEAEIEPTSDVWRRAGALRTEALPRTKKDISNTDAVVVAMAEERSFRGGVTIITSDQKDIELLVGLTRRTNIAVDPL